jgi:hypothetical protein
MMDMKSPVAGSSQTPRPSPPTSAPTKQAQMAAPMTSSAPVHFTRSSSQEPTKRPAARSTKNSVSAQVRSQPCDPS